jgi:hypothetical protein
VPVYHLYFYREREQLEHIAAFEQRDDDCAIIEAERCRTMLPMELRRGTQVLKKWDWLLFVPPFP